MVSGYGGLPAVAVGRPGELPIPAPTEERMSPRRRRGLIPGNRGCVHAAELITPNNPWLSSSGPAVKKSEFVGPELSLPVPNSSAQSPSIVMGTPPAPRRTPARSKPPFASGAYAMILPSPKFPTSRSLLKRPKSDGAHASPQGALSAAAGDPAHELTLGVEHVDEP